MKKVYAPLLPGKSYIPLLYPNLGAEERESILFLSQAFRFLTKPLVKIVDTVEQADAILIPHNYSSIAHRSDYLRKQAQLAINHGKKLIVFWHGDSDASVNLPNTTVFRTSQYGYKKQSTEIMMPAYADDLLEEELQLRSYDHEQPVVGFCGWANYKNVKNMIGTVLKDAVVNVQSLVQPYKQVHHKGISIRMHLLKSLQQHESISTNFVIRSSYSGHKKTISIKPELARQEYIENMLNSDIALVIKGDGNYSYRFYEALSLGRVPLLIDTDCTLPLEDIIDYDQFMLRLPYAEVDNTANVVTDWWKELNEKKFAAMQKQARATFKKHLRVDAYFADIVERYF